MLGRLLQDRGRDVPGGGRRAGRGHVRAEGGVLPATEAQLEEPAARDEARAADAPAAVRKDRDPP